MKLKLSKKQVWNNEVIFMAMTCLCLETFIFLELFINKSFSLFLLLVHISLLFGLFIWILTLMRRKLQLTFSILLFLTTSVLGVFGVVGTLGCMFLLKSYQNNSPSLNDWLVNQYLEFDNEHPEHVFQNIVSGNDSASSVNVFSSFKDTLEFGSFQEKQFIISDLARNFRTEFAPILKIALADKDLNVRVQAATVVAKIEKKYGEQIQLLQEKSKSGRFNDLAELANYIDQYAYLGLFDKIREHEMQKTALHYYMQCQRLKPNAKMVNHAIGRLLVKLNRLDHAMEHFRKHRTALMLNSASWYCECLFKLGKYDKLKNVLHQLELSCEKNAILADKMGKIIDLWCGGFDSSTRENNNQDTSVFQNA